MVKAIQNEANAGKNGELGDDMLTSAESTRELQDSFSQSAGTDATCILMEIEGVSELRQSLENVILSLQKLIVDQEKIRKSESLSIKH